MDFNHTPPPLRGSAALRLGQVTRRNLNRDYRQVLPDVYLPWASPLDAVHRAQTAWIWSRGRACLTGRSAAALWGVSGIAPAAPAAISSAAHLRPPRGVELYRTTLPDDEHTEWLGIRLTTPARTAYEVARRLPLIEALSIIEQLYQRTGLTPDDVRSLACRHAGTQGMGRLRVVVDYSRTGIPSPFHSRTRAVILNSRLPRPEVLIDVHGNLPGHLAQAHIGWREQRVAVQCLDYCSPAELDNLNKLVEQGWLAFAVREDTTRGEPSDFFLRDRIEHALRHRGARL